MVLGFLGRIALLGSVRIAFHVDGSLVPLRSCGPGTTLFSFQNLIMGDECPICLEQLTGTIVHMECCKKEVHIQCYVPRCPFCRAELPVPIHAISTQHVIVPVGVPFVSVPPPKWKIITANVICAGLITVFIYSAVFTAYRGVG